MRISDWSSDVCSSDLHHVCAEAVNSAVVEIPCDYPAYLGPIHNQIEREVLDEELRSVAQRLLIQRMQNRVPGPVGRCAGPRHRRLRSEEHTSELQSLMRISYAVFCLKKKNKDLHQTN